MKEDAEEFEEEDDEEEDDDEDEYGDEDDDLLLDEAEEDHELFQEQLEKHPDYLAFLEQKDPFDVVLDEQGQEVSPLLHITTHVLLEKQIEENDPVFVRQTVEKMEARGDDPHNARHAIMAVLIELMGEVMTGGKPFNLKRYEKELRRL
ncbi:DUF1841 family protein [Candidatus Sumerlaeota bacterium]|nr:DUF1841 family protein [Candidatus Sumerlaeota bacterium]